jgi:hypothetical protein
LKQQLLLVAVVISFLQYSIRTKPPATDLSRNFHMVETAKHRWLTVHHVHERRNIRLYDVSRLAIFLVALVRKLMCASEFFPEDEKFWKFDDWLVVTGSTKLTVTRYSITRVPVVH